MTTERDIIAKKLKAYRHKHDINQFEFAEECGISRETLSLIERCRTNLTLDTLDLLAVRMNLTVSELLSNEILYFLIESKKNVNNAVTVSYGIGVMKDFRLVDYALNISDNETEVIKLIGKFNQEQMSINHLHDATKTFA